MTIARLLARKGSGVTSVLAGDSVQTAVNLLATQRIGALVVRDRFNRLAGILSERDVVHGLREHGATVLGLKVEDLMTKDVLTCKPGDTVKNVMSMMTLHRVRHVPVMDGDHLVGIVSIGDVVKFRLDEREHEVTVLQEISRLRT